MNPSELDAKGIDNRHLDTRILLKFINNKDDYIKNIKLNDSNFNNLRSNVQILNDKYQHLIATTLEKNNNVEAEIENIRHLTNDIKKEFETNDIAKEELSDNLGDFTAEIDELKNKLYVLRQDRNYIQSLIDKKTQELESNHEAVDVYQKKLFQLEKVLGLKFINEDGSLKMIFTNLSITDPHKKCSFTIKLTNDRYAGINCDPPIKQFDSLICDLNNGLEFGLFLCYMRKAFKNVI